MEHCYKGAVFSAGAVCRDSKGCIVKAISHINLPCDPNFGETLAAQLIASLAASLNFKKFSLEGDSSVVITTLQNPSISLDWHIESVIVNTLFLLPASPLWEAKKIYKSVNFCAHHVAYWAATRVFSGYILTYSLPPPPYVVERIHLPLLLSSIVRHLAPWFVNTMFVTKKKKETKNPKIINNNKIQLP